jgi:uncharacterized protein
VTDILLALPFGLAIGLALGGVGGGGSILAVPLLVYALGFTPHQATAASLIIVGSAAVAGGISQAHAGRVDVRTATLFASFAIPGAIAGAGANNAVSGRLLLTGFAVLLLVAAWLMRRSSPSRDRASGSRTVPRTILIGVGTGALTGFFGVGGGFLIVPALVLVLGVPITDAVGTSLIVITVASIAALAVHVTAVPIPWAVTAAFTATAMLGALLGTRLAKGATSRRLTNLFAALAVAVAAFLLVANLPTSL